MKIGQKSVQLDTEVKIVPTAGDVRMARFPVGQASWYCNIVLRYGIIKIIRQE